MRTDDDEPELWGDGSWAWRIHGLAPLGQVLIYCLCCGNPVREKEKTCPFCGRTLRS